MQYCRTDDSIIAIYVNAGRFVCDIIIYWITVRIFTGVVFLQTLRFGIDGNLPVSFVFLNSFSKIFSTEKER